MGEPRPEESTEGRVGQTSKVPVPAEITPVPLEYPIEWLTCAFAIRRDVVLVSLPGAAQDRLFAHAPGTAGLLDGDRWRAAHQQETQRRAGGVFGEVQRA